MAYRLRIPLILGLFAITIFAQPVMAFCGFYVARADGDLFNNKSQVVIARDGERTVLTMASDYQGALEDFALVVPIPHPLKRSQINVGNQQTIDHLDRFTAPRLVEYHDQDPCRRIQYRMAMASESAPLRKNALGVTVTARYSVGEYDIVLLDADHSQGLLTWLNQNGYQLPEKARPIIGSYLQQGLHFFVAKVNLARQKALGYQQLRPLQMAYESRRFMLPIRLGTVNAKGDQDLLLYTLTRTGRVEVTNYPTIPLPTGQELPVYVKNRFGDFYQALFSEQVKNNPKAVFLEYAWNMNWCDPCAAEPLSAKQLRSLGAWWLKDSPTPVPGGAIMPRPMPNQGLDVYVTRLHVRYNATTFPEDLMLQATGNKQNFQGRYILRHAWQGDAKSCPQAKTYLADQTQRRHQWADNLASLTGWPLETIYQHMNLNPPTQHQNWWQKLWSN